MPKIFFLFMMFCINPIVTNHFEVLVRDMNNQAFYKVKDGEAFCNRLMILMPGVMKCHGVTIIRINSGGSNNRSSEISADIFNHCIRITEIGFSIHIKTIFMLTVDKSFRFFERRSNAGFEKIEKGCLKRLS